MKGAAYRAQRLRDSHGEAHAWVWIARSWLTEGHLDGAKQAAEEAASLARGLEAQGLEARALFTLSRAHEERGEASVARDLLKQALQLFSRAGDAQGKDLVLQALDL
jgi:hypothetical protein